MYGNLIRADDGKGIIFFFVFQDPQGLLRAAYGLRRYGIFFAYIKIESVGNDVQRQKRDCVSRLVRIVPPRNGHRAYGIGKCFSDGKLEDKNAENNKYVQGGNCNYSAQSVFHRRVVYPNLTIIAIGHSENSGSFF